MLFALGILAYLGLPLVMIGALKKQIRGSRFARMEREFFACWTRLPPASKRCIVARAWGTVDLPTATGTALDQLMARALEERWHAMCKAREFDFVQLRNDLEQLLKADSEGMMLR